MKGIIIIKTKLFSVALTENKEFNLLKNNPKASVGSTISFTDMHRLIIPKPIYCFIRMLHKIKTTILSVVASVSVFH